MQVIVGIVHKLLVASAIASMVLLDIVLVNKAFIGSEFLDKLDGKAVGFTVLFFISCAAYIYLAYYAMMF